LRSGDRYDFRHPPAMCPEPEEARAVIRSSHGSKVLRRILIGALALLVPVLAGCEAGNNAPTLEFHPAANGAYGTADAVTVDNAFILGGRNNTLLASGSSASMFLYLYNGSGSADKLISVSAPGTATSVQITGGSVTVPANGAADLSGPEPQIVLNDLTSALPSGKTVTVDLTFQDAGELSLTVPVQARTSYYSSYSPPPPRATSIKQGTAGARGTATPSPSLGASAQPSASASPTP
jgi:copper(I)-binding protein